MKKERLLSLLLVSASLFKENSTLNNYYYAASHMTHRDPPDDVIHLWNERGSTCAVAKLTPGVAVGILVLNTL